MAEQIREVVVTIEVDTNKYTRRLTWEGETEEFERRVVETISKLTELP